MHTSWRCKTAETTFERWRQEKLGKAQIPLRRLSPKLPFCCGESRGHKSWKSGDPGL